MSAEPQIVHDGPYPLPLKILYKIRKLFAPLSRPKRDRKMKETLKDVEFTVFCNNCLGGVFCHDAGQPFRSPTVNLSFDGFDFIRFLERPEYYLSRDIEFYVDENRKFPMGRIEDVKIYFVHYKTPEEARNAWMRRKDRIVWDNIFVISTDHDGMYLPELMERFDKLPYQNKVMFTAKSYPQYPWAVQVRQFKHRRNVRIMSSFANFRGQRYYETCFDLAEWIKKNSTSRQMENV